MRFQNTSSNFTSDLKRKASSMHNSQKCFYFMCCGVLLGLICAFYKGFHLVQNFSPFLQCCLTQKRAFKISELNVKQEVYFNDAFHFGDNFITARFSILDVDLYCKPPTSNDSRPIVEPLIINYQVPFTALYLSFNVILHDCDKMDVRFISNHINGNYSVGLGINRIPLTFTMIHEEKRSAVRILMIITRLNRGFQHVDDISEFAVCRLRQHCNFLLYPRESCGLSAPHFFHTSWHEFHHYKESLSKCNLNELQNSDGAWWIPCLSCAREDSCIWSQAEWINNQCAFEKPHPDRLRSKLANKTVILVGDSTVRGLYYSLILSLNGSLNNWERSHSTINQSVTFNHIPTNVNSNSNLWITGQTKLMYKYYPCFWKSTSQDNGLHRYLTTLLSQNNFSQNEEVLILIGGAQWLTSRHLNMLKSIINNRPNLNISVIVKDFSAGFFLPITGVTYKSLSRQSVQNFQMRWRILQLIQKLQFHLLPTHSLTWSRLDEFQPGKCLCHFHTVVSSRHCRSDLSVSSNKNNPSNHSSWCTNSFSYDIGGTIHWTYSNILEDLITQMY